MQAGLSTYSFPWAIGLKNNGQPQLSAAMDLLQFAHAHQIKHVQFGDNLPLHLLAHEDLKKLQQAAVEANILIEVGARGLKEAHVRRYLSIARQLGSPFLRMVIDEEGYEPDEHTKNHSCNQTIQPL